MKLIFQLVGFVLVIAIVLMSVLFYLDGKNQLAGELVTLVRKLHVLGTEAWDAIFNFSKNSGIAEDAADVLEASADKLRGVVAPHETSRPGDLSTPEPTVTPAPTATPTPSPEPHVVFFGLP